MHMDLIGILRITIAVWELKLEGSYVKVKG